MREYKSQISIIDYNLSGNQPQGFCVLAGHFLLALEGYNVRLRCKNEKNI